MAGVRAVIKKRRAPKSKSTSVWKPQRAGLPDDVRKEIKSLLKSGKTAAELAAAEAAKEAAKRAAEHQPAPARGEPQAAAQTRNHHKQRTRLPVVLTSDWERVEGSGGKSLRGVRRRLPMPHGRMAWFEASQRQRAAKG